MQASNNPLLSLPHKHPVHGQDGHPRCVGKGCVQPTPARCGHPPSLPLGLPLAPLQKQQPATTANCCKIATLHFRVLLAFASGAGKSSLQGIIITSPWPRSLDFWPLSLACLRAGLEDPPPSSSSPSPSSHGRLPSRANPSLLQVQTSVANCRSGRTEDPAFFTILLHSLAPLCQHSSVLTARYRLHLPLHLDTGHEASKCKSPAVPRLTAAQRRKATN